MQHRFDLLTKIFAGEGSRREMLKQFGGLLAGGGLIAAGVSCGGDPASRVAGTPRLDITAPGRCKPGGRGCREHPECCSNFCDPATATCACAPGQFVCPETGMCVECQADRVFDPTTCSCQCPPELDTCSGENNTSICCVPHSVCCTTVVGSPFCCPPEFKCCPGLTGVAVCCSPNQRCSQTAGVPFCCTGLAC